MENEQGGEIKINRKEKGKVFKKGGKKILKRKEIVSKRKERLRRKGKATKADTKYTGRKRKPRF